MLAAKRILPVIVFSQFCCTSLWFASNGVMGNLQKSFGLPAEALGHLTAAVQFGFILGTLVFALFSIADRYSPSKVFLICAVAGALANAGLVLSQNTQLSLAALRFITGFFLAGIYPVGMKIAADHFNNGLGKSLGFLVGALVLGTAFPHLLRATSSQIHWENLILIISSVAVIGGLLMATLVADGPYRIAGQAVKLSSFWAVFKNKQFRVAAFGYFGHMWELYTFWAFVPVILSFYNALHPATNLSIALLSFTIIGVGSLGCVVAGYMSEWLGTRQVAKASLVLSGSCCLLFPFFIQLSTTGLFIAYMLVWGITVVADSPMFSTMVANNADPAIKGTALTMVNSIGFAITIVSIQLIGYLWLRHNISWVFAMLAVGPALGLVAQYKKHLL